MSKYIRTKDRVCELTGAFAFCNGNKNDILNNIKLFEIVQSPHYMRSDEIINEADTIEELCDCFVYINKGLPNPTPKIYYCWTNLMFENQCEEELGLDRDWCEVYAAIWTGKGLIYVARKMKEYGEWILL